MTMLRSLTEFESLVDNRPEQSRTYQVDPAIAPEIRKAIRVMKANGTPRVRRMSPAEMRELAGYLDISVADFHGPITVSDITCQGCGRHLSVLDIAKTSVDTGLHTKALLAKVLTGQAGHWVTIRGRDGGRYADCAACGLQSPTPFEDYECAPGPDGYEWA